MTITKYILSLVSILGIAAPTGGAADARSPSHVVISAELKQVQYIGIPAPISITIKNNWSLDETQTPASIDDTFLGVGAFKDLPEEKKREIRRGQYLLRTKITCFPCDILDSNPSYQIQLAPADHTNEKTLTSPQFSWAIEWYDPPEVVQYPKRKPTVSINAGEIRENLGSFLDISGVAEGDYLVSLKIAGIGTNGSCDPVPITVRALPANASELIRDSFSRRNEVVPKDSVSWVTKNWDVDYALSTLPVDVADNIVLFAFLRKAAVAGKIKAAPINLLDRFPSYLSGLASTLRFEVAMAKRNQVEIARLRREVIANHPGLVWRLEAAEKGEGLIAKAILLSRH